MLSLVASSVYRTLRDRRLRLALILVAAIEVAGAALFWLSATPMGEALNPGSHYTLTVMASHLLTASAPVPAVVASVCAAALAAEDAETGFGKTLHPFCRARVGERAARLAAVALETGLVLLTVALTVTVAYRLLGFDIVAEDGARQAGYFGCVALQALAYAWLSALVTWATRSKAAGVTCAVLVASGLAGGLVQMALATSAPALPAAADVAAWLPSWAQSGKLLQVSATALWAAPAVAGTSAPVHAALVGALWCAGSSLLSLALALRGDAA